MFSRLPARAGFWKAHQGFLRRHHLAGWSLRRLTRRRSSLQHLGIGGFWLRRYRCGGARGSNELCSLRCEQFDSEFHRSGLATRGGGMIVERHKYAPQAWSVFELTVLVGHAARMRRRRQQRNGALSSSCRWRRQPAACFRMCPSSQTQRSDLRAASRAMGVRS